MNLKAIIYDIKKNNEKINTKVELLKHTRKELGKIEATDKRQQIEFEVIIEGLEKDIQERNEINNDLLWKLEQVIG